MPAEEYEILMGAKDYLDTVEAIRVGLQAAAIGLDCLGVIFLKVHFSAHPHDLVVQGILITALGKAQRLVAGICDSSFG